MSFFSSLRFGQILHLVPALCVLSVLCVPISAQDFKPVHDGVEYAQVDYKLGSDPLKINLLRLDLTKVRLDVHHAMDTAIGTEKTSSISTRHRAVAGINAGFFRLDTSIFAGEPSGAMAIDNNLLSESVSGRTALFIKDEEAAVQSVSFHRLEVNAGIQIQGKQIDLSGINRERLDNEIILYTPEFHRTSLTQNSGLEIIVRNHVITNVIDGTGNNIIPENGFVISANGARKVELLANAIRGRKVFINYISSFPGKSAEEQRKNGRLLGAFSLANDIVGGVPQLIRNGKIDITWEQEKASRSFAESRHPRTAVAKLKDGKFLMITVDGRQPGVSVGMSLQELAEYLLSLGAVDAMNLDGGGSTTMFLDGKVVNTPSDKEGERKVGDAILVTLRKKVATSVKK